MTGKLPRHWAVRHLIAVIAGEWRSGVQGILAEEMQSKGTSQGLSCAYRLVKAVCGLIPLGRRNVDQRGSHLSSRYLPAKTPPQKLS